MPVAMFEPNSKQAPYARSKSTLLFRHDFSNTSTSGHVLSPPLVAYGSAYSASPPSHLHKRGRSDAGPRSEWPTPITRQVDVQSTPSDAELPISLFSGPKDISFDLSLPPSPLPSPSKERWSFLLNRGGAEKSESQAERRGLNLAEWFQGESAPVAIGILPSPTKEKANPMASQSPPTASRKLAQKKSSPSVTQSTSTTTSPTGFSGRFAFFSKQPSLPSTRQSSEQTDEFFDLDIRAALRPHAKEDAFSPSAFKNLLQNAEGILSKLQIAYRQRTLSLQEALAEREAQEEEVEEAHTRARHLKIQLDDMAARLAEQDAAMMNLVDELAKEKQARREEAEARCRTVRMVDRDEDERRTACRTPSQRPSRASTVSDSGFESNDESSADSVFSKSRGRDSPNMSVISSPSSGSVTIDDPSGFSPRVAAKLQSLSRVLPPTIRSSQSTTACSNCQGVKVSEAWSVVSMLKAENRGLKDRVGQLEESLDGCLDMVRELGL